MCFLEFGFFQELRVGLGVKNKNFLGERKVDIVCGEGFFFRVWWG